MINNNVFQVAFFNAQTASLLELMHWFKSFCELKWGSDDIFKKNWDELRLAIESEQRSLEEFYLMLQYLGEYKKEDLFCGSEFDLKKCLLQFPSRFFYLASDKVNRKFKPYLAKLKNQTTVATDQITSLPYYSKAA